MRAVVFDLELEGLPRTFRVALDRLVVGADEEIVRALGIDVVARLVARLPSLFERVDEALDVEETRAAGEMLNVAMLHGDHRRRAGSLRAAVADLRFRD